MSNSILDDAAYQWPVVSGQAQPLSWEELLTLRPFLEKHPNHSDQRLLETIECLMAYVKYVRVVRP